MSLPFKRSLRALQADSEVTMLAVLGVAIILLALWTVWFLFASIPRYATGQVIATNRSGSLIATFPLQTRLQPGQFARVHRAEPPDDGDLSAPAIVMLVERSTSGDRLAVELAAISDFWFSRTDVDAAVTPLLVDVEVEQVSPAQLVLRASGQWIDGPSVRLSPQSR
jgi:hypothetical protein